MVEEVLLQDDPTVGRYALGLIPYSTAYKELLTIAQSCAHSQEERFRDEVTILEQIVSSMEEKTGSKDLPVSEFAQHDGGGGEIKDSAAA